MKAVIQRVLSASVSVEGQVISSIGQGLLVLVGIDRYDTPPDSTAVIKKILGAKLFDDKDGSLWKLSVKDIEGEILCVSQFTLLATMLKGSKPDFHQSMSTEPSRELYHSFLDEIGKAYRPEKIKNGRFGAMMQVSLVNDGPTTILLDSHEKKAPSRNASASGTSTPSQFSQTDTPDSTADEARLRASVKAKQKAEKSAMYAAKAQANAKRKEEARAGVKDGGSDEAGMTGAEVIRDGDGEEVYEVDRQDTKQIENKV